MLFIGHSACFAQKPTSNVVVFVCEHGVAKSIIAAAHFNTIAKQRGLPYIAIARSTDPDDSLMVSVLEGLRGDKLPVPQKPATKLTQSDCDTTMRCIFFSPVPAIYRKNTAMQIWETIPPVSRHYGIARDSIVANIHRLIKTFPLAPKR